MDQPILPDITRPRRVERLVVGQSTRDGDGVKLVRVLTAWRHDTAYSGTAWLLYPPTRHLAPKLRVWIDFLVGRITPGAVPAL